MLLCAKSTSGFPSSGSGEGVALLAENRVFADALEFGKGKKGLTCTVTVGSCEVEMYCSLS